MAKLVFFVVASQEDWHSVGLVYDDDSYHIFDDAQDEWREKVTNDDTALDRDQWRRFGWDVVDP